MDKVLIAMSGGVDSSVAAFLMKQQGCECIDCNRYPYITRLLLQNIAGRWSPLQAHPPRRAGEGLSLFIRLFAFAFFICEYIIPWRQRRLQLFSAFRAAPVSCLPAT